MGSVGDAVEESGRCVQRDGTGYVGRGPEASLHQGGKLLYGWAQDDDVLFPERGIISQKVQDGVAQDLDLPGLSVTGVELDRTVIGVELEVTRRSRVQTEIRLDACQEAGRAPVGDAVSIDLG